MKILFLSDFVPDPRLIFDDGFASLLSEADRIIFNLEGSPLTGSDFDDDSQIMPFNCDYLIAFLEEYGKDKFVIALANNHILDNGSKGFDFLIQKLRNNNIVYFGTKCTPFININNEVAVLNFVTAETVAKYSGRHHLNYLFYGVKRIKNQINKIQEMRVTPILYPHWGRDMDTTLFKTYDLGFDKDRWLVFGHHPHVISGISDREIYSLGNTFIPHPYYYRNYPSVRYGLAIMFDSAKESYTKTLTKIVSNDNFSENFKLVCGDFNSVPMEVLENDKQFSPFKQAFLKVFAFNGTALDFFKLTALQMISGIFRLKVKYMKKKGYE